MLIDAAGTQDDVKGRGGGARPVVTVVRDGQWVYFWHPPCLALLDALRTVKHVLTSDGSHGQKIVRAPEPLTRLARVWSTNPYFLAGLEPVVYRLLIDAGYTIHRLIATSPEPTPLSPPDYELARLLGPVDDAVLDFVHRHERGLILHGAGVDPGRLVAEAALAFPPATVAVVATRDRDVHRFFDRYRRVIPGLRWATAGSCPSDVGRVVVATPYGLAHAEIKLRERDVVFALDAVEALGERPQMSLQDAARGRLFGLLARDRPLAPRDRDRLVPTFGLDTVFVPKHGFVERPVEVAFARVDGGPRPAPGLGGVELLRQGVWGHPVRNRRLARLAEALSVGDRALIVDGFPAVAWATVGLPPYPTVVVLAAGLEHALALADGLRGCPLVVGPDLVTAGLPARRVEVLNATRWAGPGDPGVAVVTPAGLGAVDLGGVDALIRADAGVGLPPAADELISGYHDNHPLVLIDSDDRHHPHLRRRSRARRAAYTGLGWPVDGVPAPSALETFLAARPGRTR